MKITYVIINCFYKEGQGYQENILSRKHKQQGHDVSIITYDQFNRDRKPEIYINKDGVKVVMLARNKSFLRRVPVISSLIDSTKGFREALESEMPDIIFIHGIAANDHYKVIDYKKRHPSVKIFVDNHNDFYNGPVISIRSKISMKIIYRHLAKKIVPYCEKFWGVTPWRVQYLQEIYGVPKEKTDLLVMGADESYIVGVNKEEIRAHIREIYNIPQNAFVVVTGGKIDKRKQQNLLFEAIKQINNDNIRLLVFGSPSEEMKSIVDDYSSCKNIVFTGWVQSEKAYEMFFASDLAIFPGTHSVLWEQSVACEIPLVVKHWSGMEHVNVNGNAVFIDEVSVESIKNVILQLNNTPQYNEMRNKVKDISNTFYYNEIAKKAIGVNE